MPNPLIVCYGMSEIGPAIAMGIGDSTLVNKVGKLLPGVKARRRKDNGQLAGVNERGLLEVDVSGAKTAMKGYFQKPELTEEFWTEDWYAKTGDVAIRDEDGNYEVLGRGKDYFIDENGSKHYLFDIENFVYKDESVLEAEAVKLFVKDQKLQIPVIHIVLKDRAKENAENILKRITENAEKSLNQAERPLGYRFIDAFGTNPISTKRDYLTLAAIRDGYYTVKDGQICEIEFPETGEFIWKDSAQHIVIHNK